MVLRYERDRETERQRDRETERERERESLLDRLGGSCRPRLITDNARMSFLFFQGYLFICSWCCGCFLLVVCHDPILTHLALLWQMQMQMQIPRYNSDNPIQTIDYAAAVAVSWSPLPFRASVLVRYLC